MAIFSRVKAPELQVLVISLGLEALLRYGFGVSGFRTSGVCGLGVKACSQSFRS